MPQVDVATRLNPYGLKAADLGQVLTNLHVAQGQRVRITRDDPNLGSHVKQVAPKQVDELKRMIGVPDTAFRHLMPRTIGRPSVVSSRPVPQLTAVEHASLWTTARTAILGHSASVSASELASVNQWLARINPLIYIVLFQDITVEANAELILAPDIHVLYANNILIQQGGQITCLGTVTKFDCASLKGFAGPQAGTGTGTA